MQIKLTLLIKTVCLIMAASLVGCASYQSASQSPTNLLLVLHEDISVESGRARVFLQNGEVTRTNKLQTYEPSCDFEVIEVSAQSAEQIIYADEFQVTRIYYAPADYTNFEIEMNQQYAQEGFEYPNTTYLTEFTLKSKKQDDVLRLNCKIWSIDPFQQYLSPEQIDRTLGKIATFKSN